MSHAAPTHARMRGTLISTPIDGGKVVQSDTVQCVHCQAVWQWKPGSGKTRGFCLKCNGFFCGPQCEACVPIEQVIENLEAGMPYHLARQHRPIRVTVDGDVPEAPKIILGKA